MAHSPLSLRTEVVKELVQNEFPQLMGQDLEIRRMECTLLQILAPIYAPPRSATPIDAEHVFRVALQAKHAIDAREQASLSHPQFIRPTPRRPCANASPFVLFDEEHRPNPV